MSCDTILRLKGHITAEQIVDYIDEHYKFMNNIVRCISRQAIPL